MRSRSTQRRMIGTHATAVVAVAYSQPIARVRSVDRKIPKVNFSPCAPTRLPLNGIAPCRGP